MPGMKTKFWGPRLWDSLFCIVTGRYPDIVDPDSFEDLEIQGATLRMLADLEILLPCIYCRRSYVELRKSWNVEHYKSTKLGMLTYLYTIRSLVAMKLRAQEREADGRCVTPYPRSLEDTMEYYLSHASGRCSND